MRNSKKYYWSVWINVTTEIIKEGYSSLDQAGIQYLITGSVASSLQGEPRSTNDIDMVVAIQKSQVMKLVENFPPPDFYLDKDSILEAISRQSLFNLIDVNTGDKVDFWIVTAEPFDQSRFSRRYRERG